MTAPVQLRVVLSVLCHPAPAVASSSSGGLPSVVHLPSVHLSLSLSGELFFLPRPAPAVSLSSLSQLLRFRCLLSSSSGGLRVLLSSSSVVAPLCSSVGYHSGDEPGRKVDRKRSRRTVALAGWRSFCSLQSLAGG